MKWSWVALQGQTDSHQKQTSLLSAGFSQCNHQLREDCPLP